MRFTKTLCGVTAALTVLSSMAVTAQAEETQLKLLTADISEINGTTNLSGFGGGYYLTDSGFCKIGEEQIAEWRESGKLTYQIIESDLNVSELEFWSGNFDSGYVQFVKRDTDRNVSERYVVHLDKAAGKISTVYTLPAVWSYTKSDGYSLSFDESYSELAVNVYDPTGKKTTTVLSYSDDEAIWYSGGSFDGGENVGYVMFKTKHYAPRDEEFPWDSFDFDIYIIKKTGELELTHKNEYPYVYFGFEGGMENAFMWYEGNPPRIPPTYIYSIDEKKVYTIGTSYSQGKYNTPDYWSIDSSRLVGKLYGTKVIIEGTINTMDEKQQTGYVLVNLREVSDNPKDNEKMDLVSGRYKYMSTYDGKIYLVQTTDDKWGYIDENGNELAMFDDAGAFRGDYAPVVNNGKAFLIDRGMNKVSDELDGDSTSTFNDDFFMIRKGDTITFATYKQNSVNTPNTSEPTTSEPTTSDPVTSEPTTSEPVTSEPATSEPITLSEPTSSETASSEPSNSNESNPATGVTMAMIPVALIGGAVVIVLKKKK